MTILGFHVSDPQHAVAWTDSEIYCDGEPAGEACKPALNAIAGIVGIGTGPLGWLREAGAAVQASVAMDNLLVELSIVLRSARRPAIAAPAARALMPWARYCVVGYSPRLGRVAGWVFFPENDFEAGLSGGWCCPEIDALSAMVSCEHSALAAGQAQVAELRRLALPRASGGKLIVLAVEGRQITVREPIDLETGTRPPGASRGPRNETTWRRSRRRTRSREGRLHPLRARPAGRPK